MKAYFILEDKLLMRKTFNRYTSLQQVKGRSSKNQRRPDDCIFDCHSNIQKQYANENLITAGRAETKTVQSHDK